MIQLLFTAIGVEVAMIMIMLFKTPLRKLEIMGLDRVKRGRGPVVVKTMGGTVLIILMSSVYDMKKIQKRSLDGGVLDPTDLVLFSNHLLEASLMGFTLILSLMIDRLHHYIRELRPPRKSSEDVKKQNRAAEDGRSNEIKNLEVVNNDLKEKIRLLESDTATKAKTSV